MAYVKIAARNDYPEGADVIAFVKCDDRRGIKIFRSAQQAESARAAQSSLSSIGLAPNCAECIRTVEYDGKAEWAYYTDRAEMFDQTRWTDDAYVAGCEEDAAQLKESLRAAGFDWADGEDHTGNYGWIDGRCVLVDCGN